MERMNAGLECTYGTFAGERCDYTMFDIGLPPNSVRMTPGTRGQVEQTSVGPTPAGLHTYRCRVCMLNRRGSIYIEATCTDMTHEETKTHLREEGHLARSVDGRLERYIKYHEDREWEIHEERMAALPGAPAPSMMEALANAHNRAADILSAGGRLDPNVIYRD